MNFAAVYSLTRPIDENAPSSASKPALGSLSQLTFRAERPYDMSVAFHHGFPDRILA
jgi:hypothetical protein